MKNNLVQQKSYEFALKVIALYKELVKQNEFVLSRQMLRAGTSIGANVEEALAGQSRADFLSKMAIASKEARETRYWLRLLKEDCPENKDLDELILLSEELIRILTKIILTSKNRNI